MCIFGIAILKVVFATLSPHWGWVFLAADFMGYSC